MEVVVSGSGPAPAPGPARTRRRLPRRPVIVGAGALAAVVAAVAVWGWAAPDAPAHRAAYADGLPHTRVDVLSGACGRGWDHPRPGRQAFDVRNTSGRAVEVYLRNARTGAVLGEVEGLGPGTTRTVRADVGGGSYAFACYPDDAVPVTGPTVKVPDGAGQKGGPAAVPVSLHDLIPPTLSYQHWVTDRMDDLVTATGALRSAIRAGDLGRARAAWLPAHLVYERMGAAYGTFGDADQAINGTTAGLPGGAHDKDFTGFHRIEYGLWHGESASALRPLADQLTDDVSTLRTDWKRARMDPLDVGLRAHEILENTLQFELTGRTDYGSGSSLATARANLDGTRAVLTRLRPLLTTRYPGLTELETELASTQRLLDQQKRPDHDGGWTPLKGLDRSRREKVNADVGELLERLADIAALCDVRRTP
ncbi:iron transporter [Streptomyces sp. 150FB]|nr:iron transporter [Streptomyces sp. 150FB]